MTANLIYGPVPSRRLGLSLGVDLVPYKVCSYDCVYCQIGRTLETTLERRPYVTAETIVPQLDERLNTGARPDYITLGGSGEPTLNSDIGEIILKIRKITDIPVALLTNGSLLMDAKVRNDICGVDVVLPSFDACDEDIFLKINRPHSGIRFEDTAEGLIEFRKEYNGLIWLEIFFVDGINADEDMVKRYLPWMEKFKPDKIHLNTAVRPTAEFGISPLSEAKLVRVAEILGEKAQVIATFSRPNSGQHTMNVRDSLLNMLSRRPCSLDDMAAGLGLHSNEILKHLDPLMAEKLVEVSKIGGRIFYQGRKV
ncbi:MAG: radical SAM protein [Desulfosalsimonadaceae bacterium]